MSLHRVWQELYARPLSAHSIKSEAFMTMMDFESCCYFSLRGPPIPGSVHPEHLHASETGMRDLVA